MSQTNGINFARDNMTKKTFYTGIVKNDCAQIITTIVKGEEDMEHLMLLII